jgi:hypothetical protein
MIFDGRTRELGVGVSVDLDEGEIMVLFYRGEGDVEG